MRALSTREIRLDRPIDCACPKASTCFEAEMVSPRLLTKSGESSWKYAGTSSPWSAPLLAYSGRELTDGRLSSQCRLRPTEISRCEAVLEEYNEIGS